VSTVETHTPHVKNPSCETVQFKEKIEAQPEFIAKQKQKFLVPPKMAQNVDN
jgi:hypothetical protein